MVCLSVASRVFETAADNWMRVTQVSSASCIDGALGREFRRTIAQ